jgi:hypothetical protein
VLLGLQPLTTTAYPLRVQSTQRKPAEVTKYSTSSFIDSADATH